MPSFALWGKIVELILFFLILLLSSFCQSCIAIFLRMIKIYCKINNIIRTNYSFKRCSDFYDSERFFHSRSFSLCYRLYLFIFYFEISFRYFSNEYTYTPIFQFFNFRLFDNERSWNGRGNQSAAWILPDWLLRWNIAELD